jgi:hypothetical protein
MEAKARHDHSGEETGLQHLEHVARGKLEALMSAVSQAVYSTSWFTNLEYMLWDALEKGDPHPFTAQQIIELRALTEASRGWVPRDRGKCMFVPLDQWRRRHNRHKKNSR